MGPTSAQCAKHGGSCCNGDAAPRGRQLWSRSPGVENGWTMDAVITNTAQFANTQSANTQLPHGFVHTTYGIVNTRFANIQQDQVSIQRDFSSMSNQADIFTVSPLSLCDL